MLILPNEVKNIKENKVTLVKNFITLETKHDFNFISKLLEENDIDVDPRTTLGHLRDVFQIRSVSFSSKELFHAFSFLQKMFLYKLDSGDEVDLFFSFVSQVGHAHVDQEEIYILGLHGTTIYRIYESEKISSTLAANSTFSKDYKIKEGDLLFIPKNHKHKVIGLTPRIIASIAFNNSKESL